MKIQTTAFGGTGIPHHSLSVAACIEEQVRLRPGKVAIKHGPNEVSYESLNRLANRLARVILKCDIKKVRHVALLFDQGSWLAVAGILAALKAGKAYVPLDPSYPPARNQYMLDHSEARVILCSGKHASLAEDMCCGQARVIDVECIDSTIADGNLEQTVTPDAPAYLLYTSGSTGHPKGVIQTQRNLLHFVRSYARKLSVSHDDRLTFFYSYSFSASLMDIYSALLHGATLLPYNIKEQGFAGLAEWLLDGRITVFHSVPTVFRSFASSLKSSLRLSDLRAIDLGGEPVYRQDVETFKRLFPPDCTLFNHLACTEASVCAQYPITHETEISGSLAPVGLDADGVELMIVDDDSTEVAVGEKGEIVVKSEFLSPGYWRDDELTRAVFRSCPAEKDRCCYHTGDLGRRLPNGQLVHLGRKDSRVKIRGHSIEVAEIEEAILGLEGVKAAVVEARQDASGEQRLVAYCVPAADSELRFSTLRSHLLSRLPDYMVPSAFVKLESLPLTSSGKIDRRALTAIVPVPQSEAEFVPPATPLEEALAEIWISVLDIERVGRHDNFFALGGHSLRAVQVVSRIFDQFDIEIPVRRLFEAPTLAQLAEIVFERLSADVDVD